MHMILASQMTICYQRKTGEQLFHNVSFGTKFLVKCIFIGCGIQLYFIWSQGIIKLYIENEMRMLTGQRGLLFIIINDIFEI